ncbi:hypothetical protein NX722_03815 [Endozoicomonas gorgoniicola]|uniref:Uncharacterized protein n=1 Tax=Endozoicomonas gorgoniicola TaxID=1234144 RepID=A0ABT3MQX7_9GAMM|nr:hypothetical protein [Endozoicomonas gorgoniicola]MCW7551778.1 hypothetical protein [Endozoicomonas gorgoniicola]
MAINNDDVKLFESQRLSDEEDGGGRATGTEVIDGNVNNLFQDISRIDRTIGDVALRKAYVGISTDNNDAYLGSHLILTEPPVFVNKVVASSHAAYLSRSVSDLSGFNQTSRLRFPSLLYGG